MLLAAWATVPHSTDNTMSRGQFLQIAMTRAQSMTPSPHAQPTGVPVTCPRSASDWLTEISLAWRCTRRSATRSSH